MLFESEIECNSDEWRWIWMKFGGVCGEYMQMLPCKNELNLMNEKIWYLLSEVFSAKKVNFWVTYNFSLSPWIPSKLGSSHSHYEL